MEHEEARNAAIARITAADDVHYAFAAWSVNCPNVSRINESGNRSALLELKRRIDGHANKHFRAMDDATLLTAPVDMDELQTWLQQQCDDALAKVNIDRIAGNVVKKYSL
jgi:hypothetical protein